jgi:WD40 repeat protein
LWDGRRGTEIAVFPGHEDIVFSGVFSPDGTRILTRGRDDTARLWDVAWASRIRSRDLRVRACSEKLVGASLFTFEETRDPIIAGLGGTDPCRRRGPLSASYWAGFARGAWNWLLEEAR